MLPADWLFLPEAQALPCLLVVRVPGGSTHFLVVWRRYGPWLQLMDPATGRRWVRAADFEREVFRHEQLLPAAAVRGWLGSDEPATVLGARLKALGLSPIAAESLLEAARRDPSWRTFAALDGATRLAGLLAGRGALGKGKPPGRSWPPSLRTRSGSRTVSVPWWKPERWTRSRRCAFAAPFS